MKFRGGKWLGVLLLMLVLISFIFAFVGTPWGYCDFLYRVHNYLERSWNTEVSSMSVHYDCKSGMYWGEFRLESIPRKRVKVYEYGSYGTEKVLVNNCYALLWSDELTSYFQDRYPLLSLEITVPFDKREALSFSNPDLIPSLFDLGDDNEPWEYLIITVSDDVEISSDILMQSLYSFIIDIRAMFPQTTLHVYLMNDLVEIHWREKSWTESYSQFTSLIEQHSDAYSAQ